MIGKSISALPLLYPDMSAWMLIKDWNEHAVEQGERFGFADLMIGAIAAANDHFLWSLILTFNAWLPSDSRLFINAIGSPVFQMIKPQLRTVPFASLKSRFLYMAAGMH